MIKYIYYICHYKTIYYGLHVYNNFCIHFTQLGHSRCFTIISGCHDLNG